MIHLGIKTNMQLAAIRCNMSKSHLSVIPPLVLIEPIRFMQVGWMTSRIDHFSPDGRTWQQRYFLNSTFYKPGGPVFLCVGGEGPPLTENVVITGEYHCALMVHLASQHSALNVALEHRYYGKSQPFADLSTPNLRFLSSRQALQDIAMFHEHIMSLLSLPPDTKWVTFGG
jgi:hypothetical protein